MIPVSGPTFYALSHGSQYFVLHDSSNITAHFKDFAVGRILTNKKMVLKATMKSKTEATM